VRKKYLVENKSSILSNFNNVPLPFNMDSTQNTEEKISTLHKKVKLLLLNKINEDQIVAELIKDGIDVSYAGMIIENVKDEISDNKNFRKELFTGICITLSGLLLNFASFIFSASTGNIFSIVFWGFVASGITVICRAFILFKR